MHLSQSATTLSQRPRQLQRTPIKNAAKRLLRGVLSDNHYDQAVTAALRGESAETAKLTTIFATSAIRPIYSGYDVSPKCSAYTGLSPCEIASPEPIRMPTSQPRNRPGVFRRRVYSENTIAGKICRIHTPPSNCRSIAYCVGRNMMNSSAPNFTTSETIFAVEASPAGEIFGDTSGRHRLRVNRFAAPIDMIAAGTSALIAIAAAAKPTNHAGNSVPNNAGTTSEADLTFTSAAIAI